MSDEAREPRFGRRRRARAVEDLGELAEPPDADQRWLEGFVPDSAEGDPEGAGLASPQVPTDSPASVSTGASQQGRPLPPELLAVVGDELSRIQGRLSELQETLAQTWAACAATRDMLDAMRARQAAAPAPAAPPPDSEEAGELAES